VGPFSAGEVKVWAKQKGVAKASTARRTRVRMKLLWEDGGKRCRSQHSAEATVAKVRDSQAMKTGRTTSR
jgi:hypothetical protein